MRIFLSKDPKSRPGEILAHVHVFPSDDPLGDQAKLTYSHSFRYIVPSGKDGEIIVYPNETAASGDLDGIHYSFAFEKCYNKDCKKKNPDGCPDIAGKINRLLVANVFHTRPTQDALQHFGTALFKALFSRDAGQLLKTKRDGSIFLQLNDKDLDAIPWEYAKNLTTFLVHSYKFARIFGHEHERPQDPLPKLPLRIVVAAPDPLDLPEWKLADLHLGDQFQNFINKFIRGSKEIMLERVLPATENQLNQSLATTDNKMATVFHFMGHCIPHKGDKGARGLLFEDEDTFKCTIADSQNLVLVPTNLRLAFLSACDSREIAREMALNGVRHTIGSSCPLPDDIARKSEAQFYHYLAQGLSVDEAMWRMRESFQARSELRQSDYLVGAMVFYSTTCQTSDNMFLCEPGELKIKFNMPPNNLDQPKKFFGRKKQLGNLNGVLRRMATRMSDSPNMYTIIGICGQGKTMLAMEAIHRTMHIFPGGIFVWQFDDEKEISAIDYMRGLADLLFPDLPKDVQNTPRYRGSADEREYLGQAIARRFKASYLLILDHADTLKHAAEHNNADALYLVNWLQNMISTRNVGVKILATSQKVLGWPGEETIPLDGLIDSDIHSGCRLFAESLNPKARMKVQKDENFRPLLRKLASSVDGHPLSLELISSAFSLSKYLDKPLKSIVNEYYDAMLADGNYKNKSLEKCFRPTIDRLSRQQRLVLYLCCLFTGPITGEVLSIVRHFIDHSEASEALAEDFSTTTIADQLKALHDSGLLKRTEEEPYRIYVALKESVRQHNTELNIRLRLPIPGGFNNMFIIGVVKNSGINGQTKYMLLDKILSYIHANTSDGVKCRSFSIRYYTIVKDQVTNGFRVEKCNEQPQVLHPCLLLFVLKASETIYDGFAKFCRDEIIPLVNKEKKIPFILCLKDDTGSTKCLTEKAGKDIVLMTEATKALQADLEKTHWIIRTEVPLGTLVGVGDHMKTNTASVNRNIEQKETTMAFKRVFYNINSYGDFVGREEDLKRLMKMLRTNHYITIKGIGGIGKTALARQAATDFDSGSVLGLSFVLETNTSAVISQIAKFFDIDFTAFPNLEDLKSEVYQKFEKEGTMLLYLDNMEKLVTEAVKSETSDCVKDAKAMIDFFRNIPKNIIILATSRRPLNWSNEQIFNLAGLTEADGAQVFRQQIAQRLQDVDDIDARRISHLAFGHPLSLRLLGGVFNNCGEEIEQFIENISEQLSKAKDSVGDRHESVEVCLQYSINHLDKERRLFLGRMKLFNIPFSSTLVLKTLDPEAKALLMKSVATNLHILWQHSWLDVLKYEEDPMLGNWRPKVVENDKKFYTLHPRIHDLLNSHFSDFDGTNSIIVNDPEMQFYTALCYGVGFGVGNDVEKQIEWCTKAATNGHLEAQLTLATCFEQGGCGVNQDDTAAFHWWLNAAHADDKNAQMHVSECYRKGVGVRPNRDKAYFWATRSINNKTDPLHIKFDLSRPLLHRAAERGGVNKVKELIRTTPVNLRDAQGWTPLHWAVQGKNIEVVELLLLESEADINVKDSRGLTPLHVAAQLGYVQVVELLEHFLDKDIDARDSKALSPLHLAAQNGHDDVVNLLAGWFGADTNAKDDNGLTPLHFAMQNRDFKVIRSLVKLGADVNIMTNNGETQLHTAALKGDIEMIRILAGELGADVNAKAKDGWTILHKVARDGSFEMVKLLGELGADVNANSDKNGTPLHMAARYGHIEVVRLLLGELNVDVDAKNNAKKTPLHMAAENRHVDVVKFLCEVHADTNAEDQYKMTPLHRVAENGEIGVVKLLLKFNANPDAKSNTDETPLHIAAENKHAEVVRILCEVGANANTKDEYGMTQLHLAAENGSLEIVELLTSVPSADTGAKNNSGETPLHKAAAKGHTKVVEFLCKVGADVNAKDQRGMTPLHRVAENIKSDEKMKSIEKESIEIVRLLICTFCADKNAKNNTGETLLHMAAEKGYIELVRFLCEVHADTNIKDQKGTIPLHRAAEKGSIEIVKLLVARDHTSTGAKNNNGETPLQLAASKMHTGVVEFLSKASTDGLPGREMELENKAERKSSTVITQSDNLDNKTRFRVYQKSLANVSMEGDFIGREKELETLRTLLNDGTHQYITIKGFGGMGKTCLAIQAAENFNTGNILALYLIGIPTLSSVIGKISQFLGIETKELEPQEQQIAVIEKLDGAEIIILYLDNMEDIKNAMDRGNSEVKNLMRFFRRMPKNVKILATSRVALSWPNEVIVELDGLTPPDGVRVFRQWSSQRKNDIDDDSTMMLSKLVNGHPLSLRLLGGVFNNCNEPMDKFLDHIHDRLSTAVESGSATERHESINACVEYSFGHLDPALRFLLGQLKLFEIPFCKIITMRALGLDITLIENSLHNLWQRSWLNRRIYQEDPLLGDWRPRAIEKDTKFYSLHPRLRDFLDEKFKNAEDANSTMLNDREIQFYSALCYSVGFGVVNNLDKQIEWCTRAANNGHLEAQLILAACYETGGGGVGEDEKEASYWYLKAAEAGDKGAQEEMQQRFHSGKGVKEDNDKSKYWKRLCDDNKTTPLNIKFDMSLPLVHRAIEYGAFDLVRSLMEQMRTDIDIKDRHGRTPLHVAAEKGHIDIFQLLAFEFNTNKNATKKDGMTPLHVAAEYGHIEILKLLVYKFGVDANATDNDGRAPLHMAAENGHIDVLTLLLEGKLNLDVNAKTRSGRTPLHLATENGHITSVKLLIVTFSADANFKDSDSQTLLHFAVKSGKIDLVRLLTNEFRADATANDNKGRMPLHLASENGHIEMVDFFTRELGMGPNVENENGETPLHWAAENGQMEIVKMLEKLGAKIDATDKYSRTPLHWAAATFHIEMVRLLCELHANVKARDVQNQTPLHYAVRDGHFEIIELLVFKFGADPYAKDKYGSTPLQLAKEYGYAEALNLLSRKSSIGTNIKDNGSGTGSIQGDDGKCHLSSVAENETDANAVNGDGQHPLDGAIEVKHMQAGANFGMDENKNRRTVANDDSKTNDHAEDGDREMDRNDQDGERGANVNAEDDNREAVANEENDDTRTNDHAEVEDRRADINGQGGERGSDVSAEDDNIRMVAIRMDDHAEVGNRRVDGRGQDGERGANVNAEDNNRGAVANEENDDTSTDDHAEVGDRRGDSNGHDDERGANVNAVDDNRETLLHIAAKNGHLENVRSLVEQGADVNAKDCNGRTLLHLATESGHVELVKLLVADFGADHKAKDSNRQTPLHMVVDNRHIKIVKLLVAELGADTNSKDCEGRTPLHIIANRGCVELIRLFVFELNVDANTKDNRRRTPLDYLVKRGHAELVRSLVDELLANTNTKDKIKWTPLHLVAAGGHFDVVELLAGDPCDVQAKDKYGWTPLHVAASGGHLDVVQLLLDKFNARVKTENKYGSTPLHIAAADGRVQVVRLLVTKYEADVDVKNVYQCTPLHLAAANGHMEVVWLLGDELKADVNAKNRKQLTPLDLAAKNGHFEVVKILQTVFGADMNIKKKYRWI